MRTEEIERLIIGGLISSPSWFSQINADLQSQHFTNPINKKIFALMEKISESEGTIDKSTLKFMANDDDVDWVIDDLNNVYGFQSEALQHAKIIVNNYTKDKIRDAAQKIDILLSKDTEIDLDNSIAESQEILNKALSVTSGSTSSRSYKEILPNFMEILKERTENEGDVSGLSSGFQGLDKLTSGFMPHQLILLAARPAMGKTAAAINIAERATRKHDTHALIFSLEMRGEELIQRSVASLSGINMRSLKTGNLNQDELDKLEANLDKIENTKIIVNDMSDATPSRIRAEALKYKRELESRGETLGLLVIDYIQLMNDVGFNPADRTGEVGSISRKLKKLAGELNLPIIALSQLNRSLEQRANKRPIASDLRDSGSLEQDADLILFLYRDEVYNQNSDQKGMAELIIGKQRSGSLGTVNLNFQGEYSRFIDVPPEGELPLAKTYKTKKVAISSLSQTPDIENNANDDEDTLPF